ncbi:hypothetical protein Tco_0270887 [Tanacetum coccineum]
MTEKYFAEYTGIEVKQFRETLLLHTGNVKKSLAERTRHKRQYDRRMNERQMQSRESKVVLSKALDASLVVTECGGTKLDEHMTSSSSGTYITHAVDADIRPVNDQVLFAEVDSNTTPDSTNTCHRGGEIDQDVEQYKLKSPLLKAELDAPEFCEFFEINDLKAQLQAKTTLICNLKNQIKSVKEASNEAKVKNAINEKVFANAALKNELRKLKGNSVDNKFAKPSILGKLVLQPPRNQLVVRQPNAFKSERPNVSKPRFDVNNVLSKPATPYYLPKVREYVLAKPHHVIAPGSDRNSQEEPYGSNDMAHNHYL